MNQTSTSNLCIGEIQIEEREKNNKQVDKEKKKKTDIIWNDLYTVVLFSWNDGDRVDQSFRLDLTRLMCYFKFWSMSQPCIFMIIWFGFSSYEFQKFVSLIFSLSFYPFDGRTISPLSFIEMAFDALRVECNSQLHEAWKKNTTVKWPKWLMCTSESYKEYKEYKELTEMKFHMKPARKENFLNWLCWWWRWRISNICMWFSCRCTHACARICVLWAAVISLFFPQCIPCLFDHRTLCVCVCCWPQPYILYICMIDQTRRKIVC